MSPSAPTGNKIVGSESAPLVTAALIVAALQDGYQTLVDHLGYWPLSANIFTLAGFALFFGLRRLNTAAGDPVDMETAKLAARRRGRAEAACTIAAAIRTRAEAGRDVPLHELADETERSFTA